MTCHWSSWTQNEHGWQLNRYICFKALGSLQVLPVFCLFLFFKCCTSTELPSSAFPNQYWQLQWDTFHLSSNSGTKNRMWLAITCEGTICVESQMWCRWWKKCFSLLSLGMHIKNKKVCWLHALNVQSKLHWTVGIFLRLVGNNFILAACAGT